MNYIIHNTDVIMHNNCSSADGMEYWKQLFLVETDKHNIKTKIEKKNISFLLANT